MSDYTHAQQVQIDNNWSKSTEELSWCDVCNQDTPTTETTRSVMNGAERITTWTCQKCGDTS